MLEARAVKDSLGVTIITFTSWKLKRSIQRWNAGKPLKSFAKRAGFLFLSCRAQILWQPLAEHRKLITVYYRVKRWPERKENFTALELRGNLPQTRQGGIWMASLSAGMAAMGVDRERLHFRWPWVHLPLICFVLSNSKSFASNSNSKPILVLKSTA